MLFAYSIVWLNKEDMERVEIISIKVESKILSLFVFGYCMLSYIRAQNSPKKPHPRVRFAQEILETL